LELRREGFDEVGRAPVEQHAPVSRSEVLGLAFEDGAGDAGFLEALGDGEAAGAGADY